MTQQLDMIPLDAASLERIGERLPKAREVKRSRLFADTVAKDIADLPVVIATARGGVVQRSLVGYSRHDVGHELVLPERAREDHR